MKKRQASSIIASMATVALLLSGCSATTLSRSSASMTYDDVYGAHDRTSIVAERLQEKERALALREAQILQREQAAEQLAEQISQPASQMEDGYTSVLASSYQESYEHRLRGMQSGTYKVAPSTKLNSGSLISYVSAYDPAQYNVMVSGDEVWVEPKYITSMFGRWGGVSNVSVNIGLFGFSNYGWGYGGGWGGYPYYGANWGYGWGGYPYYGFNWGWGGYPYYGHHHHGHHYPGGGGYPGGYYPGSGAIYGKTGNSNYRSSGSNVGTGSLQNKYSGMGSGGGGSYYRRGTTTNSGSSSASSNGSFTRPSSISGSGNSSSGNTSYRGASNTNNNYNNSSSNSYRNNSSSYTPSTSGNSVSSGGGGSSSGGGGSSSGGGGGTGYRR